MKNGAARWRTVVKNGCASESRRKVRELTHCLNESGA